MTLPDHFKILAESENYLVGHVFEYGSILDKRTGKERYIGDSYGDPTFALIDRNEKWAFLFGHDSYLWMEEKVRHINKELPTNTELFQYPFEARQVSEDQVEILDDPWSDLPGIFSFNILTFEAVRIGDFPKLSVPYDSDIKLTW